MKYKELKSRGSYESPRWSCEITDCSMPMTFDTYSECSYGCAYCFAAFRKSIGNAAKNYRDLSRLRCVNVEAVKRMFLNPDNQRQFGAFIKKRYPIQWGGMSDPFDEFEREFKKGIGKEIDLTPQRFVVEASQDNIRNFADAVGDSNPL